MACGLKLNQMVSVANWTVPPSSAVPTGSSIFKRQVSASGDSRTELMTARNQSEADVQVGKPIDRSWPRAEGRASARKLTFVSRGPWPPGSAYWRFAGNPVSART